MIFVDYIACIYPFYGHINLEGSQACHECKNNFWTRDLKYRPL